MTTVSPNPTTGVLIVDDHDGYRSVAAEVVQATRGFTMIDCASGRLQALRALGDHGSAIDLVLMDIHLGPDDGVVLTREIVDTSVDVDVLLVTTLAREDLPAAALECGARGYLPKAELSPRTLAEVTRGVYDWASDRPSRGARR